MFNVPSMQCISRGQLQSFLHYLCLTFHPSVFTFLVNSACPLPFRCLAHSNVIEAQCRSLCSSLSLCKSFSNSFTRPESPTQLPPFKLSSKWQGERRDTQPSAQRRFPGDIWLELPEWLSSHRQMGSIRKPLRSSWLGSSYPPTLHWLPFPSSCRNSVGSTNILCVIIQLSG